MITDFFSSLVIRIIEEQENIIGPLAVEQAKKIQGLNVDWDNKKIIISGDKKLILESLAKRYESIFGQASIEYCKQIIHSMSDKIAPDQIPVLLQ
jgi:hypothetical protein